jgi:hypothetical protein
MKQPTHYPRPEYCKCNAGHPLVKVYNERTDQFIWDCPLCIKKMMREEIRMRKHEATHEMRE